MISIQKAEKAIAINFLLAWFLLLAVFASPFFFVDVLPFTDLPQHLYQVYLLKSIVLQDGISSDLYRLNLFYPGGLVYWVGLLCSVFIGSGWLLAKILAALPLILHFVVGLKYLPKTIDSLIILAVSSVFLYSPSLYWGFVNFMLGWPVLMALSFQLSGDLKCKKTIFAVCVLWMLSYLSHSFWFVFCSCLVLFRVVIVNRDCLALRWLVLPFLLLASVSVVWFVDIIGQRTGRFDTAPYWFVMPWDRLSPVYIMNQALGNLPVWKQGLFFTPFLILLVFLIYCSKIPLNRTHVAISFACFVLYLLLPDKFMNSICFSGRWVPFVIMALVLSLHQVKLHYAAKWVVLFVSMLFVMISGVTWRAVEAGELEGLKDSVDHMEGKHSLLGLSYAQRSQYISGFPFIQMFAYASISGVQTFNFSFAEHGSSIISIGGSVSNLWTPGLEWHPENFKLSDINHFDYVLVQGDHYTHQNFVSIPGLKLCSPPKIWRLYCVEK